MQHTVTHLFFFLFLNFIAKLDARHALIPEYINPVIKDEIIVNKQAIN